MAFTNTTTKTALDEMRTLFEQEWRKQYETIVFKPYFTDICPQAEVSFKAQPKAQPLILPDSDDAVRPPALRHEVSYRGYARVPFVPDHPMDFPQGTGGSGVVTHYAISHPKHGMLQFGEVRPNIVCGNGITPRLTLYIDDVAPRIPQGLLDCLRKAEVSLHTRSPETQIEYTSYARVHVARTTDGWTVKTPPQEPVADKPKLPQFGDIIRAYTAYQRDEYKTASPQSSKHAGLWVPDRAGGGQFVAWATVQEAWKTQLQVMKVKAERARAQAERERFPVQPDCEDDCLGV
jgi:hypothetical protein